jgi:hypothetical protein
MMRNNYSTCTEQIIYMHHPYMHVNHTSHMCLSDQTKPVVLFVLVHSFSNLMKKKKKTLSYFVTANVNTPAQIPLFKRVSLSTQKPIPFCLFTIIVSSQIVSHKTCRSATSSSSHFQLKAISTRPFNSLNVSLAWELMSPLSQQLTRTVAWHVTVLQ